MFQSDITEHSNSSVHQNSSNDESLSLQVLVHQGVQSLVKLLTNDGSHTVEDVLRAVRGEAHLLFETECVKLALRRYTLQEFSHVDKMSSPEISSKDLERFCRMIKVTECERTRTMPGYATIRASLSIQPDGLMRVKNKPVFSAELSFHYEREANEQMKEDHDKDEGVNSEHQDDQKLLWSTKISYSIEFSRDFSEPRQVLLWCTVFAAGDSPSILRAKNIADEDDEDEEGDGWEDIDEDDDSNEEIKSVGNFSLREKEAKRFRKDKEGLIASTIRNSKLVTTEETKHQTDTQDSLSKKYSGVVAENANGSKNKMNEKGEVDYFYAGVDPDVLCLFLEITKLNLSNDMAAFCLLLAFPFYEQEWYLPGYVLDACFKVHDTDNEVEGDDY